MIELPEAIVIAGQINRSLRGKQIARATANHDPHGFAWYTGDPAEYNQKLAGKTLGESRAYAGNIEIDADDMLLVISAPFHYTPPGEKLPKKHQLLLEFADGSAASSTIQMWGGLFCFKQGELGGFNDYWQARAKPSPLAEAFSRAYFASLFDASTGKLSAKEFLATKQRIPGLGNGVLQDILWTAKIHPRCKMAQLSDPEIQAMFEAVKSVLQQMTEQGGRDTERDLYGSYGGYKTILSKNTVGHFCPECGTMIVKEAYMGGAIYYCERCQRR